MVEFDELPGVVIQANKILAVARAAGSAGPGQWKDQPSQSQRLQDRLVEDAIEGCGDGAVLGQEAPGRVKNAQMMGQSDLELRMPGLDALVRQPVSAQQVDQDPRGGAQV